MAEPVDLDPDGYGGTYKLIAGTAALDFANLVSYRGTSRMHDWLVPFANAYGWAAAAGLPAPEPAEGQQLMELRELLARLFLAIADGEEPARGDIDTVGSLAASALGRRTLRFRSGVAEWVEHAPSLRDVLAEDATRILTDPGLLGALRACPGCRWLFLDATKNHRRTWCDPADCGNRARQRRHYERRRKP